MENYTTQDLLNEVIKRVSKVLHNGSSSYAMASELNDHGYRSVKGGKIGHEQVRRYRFDLSPVYGGLMALAKAVDSINYSGNVKAS